jgi:hypothetical protein
VATALNPYIGYARTAEIAKESVKTGKPIRELVLERGLLDATQLDRILSVEAMTQPGVVPASASGDSAEAAAKPRQSAPQARDGGGKETAR